MPFQVHDPDYLIFRYLLAPNAIIIDAGANAGQSINSFKSILPDCEIFSFEPNPEFHDVLNSLSAELADVHVRLCGLSDKPSAATFFLPVVDGMRYPQETSMDIREFDKPWKRDGFQSRGAQLSFETFNAEVMVGDQLGLKPDLIKIDVEGAELAVISGFAQTIQDNQPYVFAENSDWVRVTEYLIELGYLACMPDASYTRLIPFGGSGPRANTIYVPERLKHKIETAATLSDRSAGGVRDDVTVAFLQERATESVRNGDMTTAIAYLQQASELPDCTAAVLVTLGDLKWRQFDDKAGAEAAYIAAIRTDPQSFWAHRNLGELLTNQRRPTEAIPYLEEGARLDPNSTILLRSLADAYLAAERFDNAYEVLRRHPDFSNTGAVSGSGGSRRKFVIDPSSFSFAYLDPRDTSSVASTAEAVCLPALARSLASLHALSLPVGQAEERAYFRDLMQNGSFFFVSPKNGKAIESGASVVLRDRTVLFGFPSEPAIAVATHRLGEGLPLSAIIDFERQVVISIGDKIWDFHPRHLGYLANAIVDWTPSTVSGDGLKLLIGCESFAHTALNQLSAIGTLMSHRDDLQQFSFVTTHQPLGSLRALYPEYDWQEDLVPEDRLASLNKVGALFVPMGSMRVTNDFIQRVLAHAKSNLSIEAGRIAGSVSTAQPCLWVSVRTTNRTVLNQREMLVTLCRRFLDVYVGGQIIIDGYSLPADFEDRGGMTYNRSRSLTVMESDFAAAKEIKVILDGEGRQGRVHVAVGLSILDSIALTQFVHFYFCHVGTVQHKIGWFHSCPGVIHANAVALSLNVSRYFASLSEVAALPIQLPESLVADEPMDGADEVARSLRHGNYWVKVGPVVDFVMNALSEVNAGNWTSIAERAAGPVQPRRTMPRHAVIQSYIDMYERASYLEIGVAEGSTFHAIRAARKVAVEPKFRFKHSDRETISEYHETTSDEYFEGLARDVGCQLFDVVYLDGLHTFEQTLRDLMNAIDFLSRDGIIVIDDVYPDSYHASLADLGKAIAVRNAMGDMSINWMGDVYKLVYFIQSFLPRFDYATCEDNHGQLIMWRAFRAPRPLVGHQIEQIARTEFCDIVMDRAAFNFLPNAEILRRARRAVMGSRVAS